jgi:hypothetical protein
LAYEDLNDHDELRHDPIMAVLAGKLAAARPNCAPVAGKSMLNRLELSRDRATRYHKISHDPAAIEGLFVTLLLEAHETPPQQIILDLDAAAWASGGTVLPRLLRQLLLSASVHLLRRSAAGCEAAAGEHR